MSNNEVAVIEQNALVTAFQTKGGTMSLVEKIAEQVRSVVPDVSTKKGRDEIGSLAMKVSKSKTALEKHGKELVAEQKAQIKLIDDDRIAAVKALDALRDEILAPRDAWEKAESDRKAKHEGEIAAIRCAVELAQQSTAADVLVLQQNLEATEIDGFEEYQDQAKLAKAETLVELAKIHAEKLQREAEQAELERLRKAEAERQQREHEQRIADEAVARAKAEAEAAALAEKQRAEAALNAEREAAERAKREADMREAQLKAEAEAADLRAKQAAQAERERIEAEQAAIAKADAERAANENHRKKICNDAHAALVQLGLDAEQAKIVLNAIYKNQVPNVTINF